MRVLLIHTGGTLMMRGGTDTPLTPSNYGRDMVGALPILAKIADVDTQVLIQLDSSDMQPENWVEIARTVHDALPRYDGIVIVHGTDTMAYTASALAFLIPALDRPVILTGSQRPLDRIRSDARQNLVDAFLLATRPIPEVGLAFASKLLRGCRATKTDAWGLDAFSSPNCLPLAELGTSIELGKHLLPARKRRAFDGRIEPRVLALRLFPGLDAKLLGSALENDVRGMVLKAFGAGNVPTLERSLIPMIEKSTSLDIPVVIVSQCLHAHVNLKAYRGGTAALQAGAIGAGDMTDEAALAKMMVTLGRAPKGSRVENARTAFASPIVGEMSVSDGDL